MSENRYLPVKQVREVPKPVVADKQTPLTKVFRMTTVSGEGQTVTPVSTNYLPVKNIIK
jgi:hypothetical protein